MANEAQRKTGKSSRLKERLSVELKTIWVEED
jgi:hypothetical protein